MRNRQTPAGKKGSNGEKSTSRRVEERDENFSRAKRQPSAHGGANKANNGSALKSIFSARNVFFLNA